MQSSKTIVDLLRGRGWLTAGQLGRLVTISQTYMRLRVECDDIETITVGGIKRIYTDEVMRVLHQYRIKNPYVVDQAIEAAKEFIANTESNETADMGE